MRPLSNRSALPSVSCAPAGHLTPQRVGNYPQRLVCDLRPLLGGACALPHLSPIVALAAAVPHHEAAIQVAAQDGAHGGGSPTGDGESVNAGRAQGLHGTLSGQPFGYGLEAQPTGVELKDVQHHLSLFTVHHPARSHAHRIPVEVRALIDVFVFVSEHPTAHHKATFSLVPMGFVGSAGCVLPMDLVTICAHRRHGFVYRVAGRQRLGVHVGPHLDTSLC